MQAFFSNFLYFFIFFISSAKTAAETGILLIRGSSDGIPCPVYKSALLLFHFRIFGRFCGNKHSGVVFLLFFGGGRHLLRLPAELHLGIQKDFASSVLFLIGSVRLKDMGFQGVSEFQIQNVHYLFLNLLVLHREYDLHTAVQVAGHPVRASHIDFFHTAVKEVKDPAVLKEVSHDRSYMDILAYAGDPNLQAADPSHYKVDLHAAGRRVVKGRHDHRIAERIHLTHNVGRNTFLRVLRLTSDHLQETVLHPDRRHDQAVPFLGLRISGKHVEYGGSVLAVTLVAGKDAAVRVE